MKRLILYIALALPTFGYGQSLSIEQLWGKANQSLKSQQDILKSNIAKQELQELKSNRIPVFYIDGNLQRNLIIPTTPVPAIAFDPNAQEGAIIPLKFATKWSSKVGVQVEWKLFDPKRDTEEKLKELEIQKSDIERQRTLQNWKIDATLAYASIVFATQQYNQTLDDTKVYEEIVAISRDRYTAGRESSSNYILAQQELQRHLIQRDESWSILQQANQELRRYISLDTIQHLSSSFDDIVRVITNKDSNNYDVKSLEIDKSINKLQLSSIKKQLLPSLTLNGYLGEQYFSNELKLARKEEWFGNSYLNLALRIPLSGYLTSKPTLRKITLNTAVLDMQLKDIEQNDQIDNKQKQLKLLTAEKKIKSLKDIEKLATQNMKEHNDAYVAGRLLLTDYNQSILTYKKAKQDTWQAQFDYIKLLID